MSERLQEQPRLTITEDEAMADPRTMRKYYEERVTLIKTGAPAWMIRGELEGITRVEYYAAGELRGYIEGNDLDGYQVYGALIEDDQGSEAGPYRHHLSLKPVENRRLAEIMLEGEVAKALIS